MKLAAWILLLVAFHAIATAFYLPVQLPPYITKQPTTAHVIEYGTKKPFMIECEAEGEPTPSYRWTKNGISFDWTAYDVRISQQPGRGTLVISEPKEEDMGQYQCFAKNEWGVATSNSVFVRKSELSAFKEQVRKYVWLEEGKPSRLTCEPPGGWPEPSVYWLIQDPTGSITESINNSRITVDPEGSLWFSNTTKFDASENSFYICVAYSEFLNEYKFGSKVVLNVKSASTSASQNKHPPVRQYTSRKSEVAFRGEKLELYCIYGGTPLPQIVWNKNGRYIQINDRVTQGNYGKSLVIKRVEFEDEGTYTCEASNGVGDALSHSIHVEVQAVPYFTTEPEAKSADEDDTVEFRCEASGVPEPQINWIYNANPITKAAPNPRRKVFRNKIIIEKVSRMDIGNYGCNATSSLGYVYKDVYLFVLAHVPEILIPSSNKFVVNGKTTKLICRVFGAPKPKVKWIRNGQELTEERYKVLYTGDLEIKNVAFADAGEYTCHAWNKFGKVEASARLTVLKHTKITDVPGCYEVAAGATANFRCNAVTDSSLTLTIDWLRNGEALDLFGEPRFIQSTNFSLSITETTELDSGTYTCVARTEYDEVKAQATLIVQGVPNAPELGRISCRYRDAVVHWRPLGDNRAPILRYTVEHNTSFTPDTWHASKDYISATDRATLVPMSPWANYTFRIVAWNKIGPSHASVHSSEVCTTKPDFPYKNPDNVMGSGLEPTNLLITWTLMPQIEHNAPGFMYRVYYKQDIPGEDWKIEDINDWKINWFQVDHQQTYQRYRIKISAVNEKGECRTQPSEVIGYSGEDEFVKFIRLSFGTAEGVPDTVLSLDALPMGSSAFFLTWTKPAETNGILTGYRIYYQVVNGLRLEPELERKPTIIDPEVVTAKLAGLQPETKYRIHIRATTNAGEGNNYFIEKVTGSSQEPDVPVFTWRVDSQEGKNVTVYLIWQPNYNGHTGSHFFARYKLRGKKISLQTDPEYLSHELQINGLLSGETYTMTVIAVDGNFLTESAPQDIEIANERPIIQAKGNVSIGRWFTGVMLAIAFLLFVLIIVYVIKRNRCGSWRVHEMELAAGRSDYSEVFLSTNRY